MATIKLYGVIGSWWDELDAETITSKIEGFGEDKEITVRINSGGGLVSDGIAITNALLRHKGKVTVFVDGIAASAASLIAMAGDEVVMPANSLMMVHNPWTWGAGDHHELRKMADDLEKFRDAIAATYMKKTGKRREDLEALLDAETWLTAREAVDEGFADTVIDDVDSEALAMALGVLDLSAHFERAEDSPHLKDIKKLWSKGRRLAVATASTTRRKGGSMSTKDGQNIRAEEARSTPARDEGHVAATGTSTAPVQEQGQVDVAAQERERCLTIRRYGRAAGVDETQIDAVISQGLGLEASLNALIDVRAQAQLSNQGAASPIRSTAPATISGGDTEQQKTVDGIRNAVLARVGVVDHDGANEFSGRSLMDLARMYLDRAGVRASHMSRTELVSAAFSTQMAIGRHTTSDFPEILRDVAHKTLRAAWEEEAVTYPQWTKEGILNDFRPHQRVSMNQFPRFKRVVPESGEFHFATFGERSEAIWLITKGLSFAITRQAIVNDDLGAFTDVPRQMGAAGRREIQFLVSQLLILGDDLTNGQKMSHDQKPIFHADHKNLTNEVLGQEGLSLGRKMMRTHRDPSGDGVLGITPQFLLVGAELETEAEILTMSPTLTDQDNPGIPNPFRGLKTIVDANLDYADIGGSATAWYLAAAASRGCVEVAGLGRPAAPELVPSGPPNAHGQKYDVFLDVGVRCIDERGLVKSTGDKT